MKNDSRTNTAKLRVVKVLKEWREEQLFAIAAVQLNGTGITIGLDLGRPQLLLVR